MALALSRKKQDVLSKTSASDRIHVAIVEVGDVARELLNEIKIMEKALWLWKTLIGGQQIQIETRKSRPKMLQKH